MIRKTGIRLLALTTLASLAPGALAQGVGYDDTPQIPGQEWRVHDIHRPNPPIVDPGPPPEHTAAPPSDAIVLFDGSNLDAWQHPGGKDPQWKLADEHAMQVTPGTGMLETKHKVIDYQLHIEFATPREVQGDSQERGNSGVFLAGRYEVQVLDSFHNKTYADGQAGAIYGQWPPLVNASRGPGEWQSYDIVFEAPRFADDGKLERPAYITVFHNGVLVQDHRALTGATMHRAVGRYTPHELEQPIQLQDHGNTTRFRNIWLRPIEIDLSSGDAGDAHPEDHAGHSDDHAGH
jgi:hypothetical protein